MDKKKMLKAGLLTLALGLVMIARPTVASASCDSNGSAEDCDYQGNVDVYTSEGGTFQAYDDEGNFSTGNFNDLETVQTACDFAGGSCD